MSRSCEFSNSAAAEVFTLAKRVVLPAIGCFEFYNSTFMYYREFFRPRRISGPKQRVETAGRIDVKVIICGDDERLCGTDGQSRLPKASGRQVTQKPDANQCRLSLRERKNFRGAKGDNEKRSGVSDQDCHPENRRLPAVFAGLCFTAAPSSLHRATNDAPPFEFRCQLSFVNCQLPRALFYHAARFRQKTAVRKSGNVPKKKHG
ncbi:MAG: hypothetical protein EXS05_01045 [Planctomycetaceae bacterium]|nr:hypothetical protein [Planctomycetaceae bacterium]